MTRPKAKPGADSARIGSTGDTFMTVMGWLNQVQAGGGTAFDHPQKEQLIEPSKGAIAIWHNLQVNGHLQFDSSHGGCPILSGSKWILNKWIYFFDQWKNYPCKLNPHSTYSSPFRGSYMNTN